MIKAFLFAKGAILTTLEPAPFLWYNLGSLIEGNLGTWGRTVFDKDNPWICEPLATS
jgi:hypothetical protein